MPCSGMRGAPIDSDKQNSIARALENACESDMRMRIFHILLLLVLGLILSGAELQSEVTPASARVLPPYRMSGQRGQRSLQGLLAFLYGFRLGQGLATGFQTKLYNPLSPFPQVIVVPANQQQIVNLQRTEDVGENYQEMNGDNAQTINNFAGRLRLIGDSVRHYENNKSDNQNMSLNEQSKVKRIKLNEFRANDKVKFGDKINASLELNKATKNPTDAELHDKFNDKPNDDLMENTTPLTQTSTTDATDEITTAESVIQTSTTRPKVYPNRTHPYPNRSYTVNENIELLSITTEVSSSEAHLDRTYLHTLALPLENDNWQLFYKVKHSSSGFQPIIGNYYDSSTNEIYTN